MDTLGEHWVFSPFRSFMTIEQITLILVHVCGLFFDFVGAFLTELLLAIFDFIDGVFGSSGLISS
ncbi:unnamed protein product, partial [Adineta steineri]